MYITHVFDIVGINVLNKHAKINNKSDPKDTARYGSSCWGFFSLREPCGL